MMPRSAQPATVVVVLCLLAPATAGAQADTAPGRSQRPVAIQAFAQLTRMAFAAGRSFDAVLGDSTGLFIGAGGRVVLTRGPLRGLFAELSVDRFRRNGEQVFVFEGEVFYLGIANTITITPLSVTAGYRFGPMAGRVAPYVGAGVSSYAMRETSESATPAEEVRMRVTGYRLTGGVDVHLVSLLGIGTDVRWTGVPAPATGVFQEFGERNLGGWSVGLRLFASF